MLNFRPLQPDLASRSERDLAHRDPSLRRGIPIAMPVPTEG
jgi:hypothetical protein